MTRKKTLLRKYLFCVLAASSQSPSLFLCFVTSCRQEPVPAAHEAIGTAGVLKQEAMKDGQCVKMIEA